MFSADYTGVEEVGDFSPIPKGDYILRVFEVDEGKSGKGHPMVKVTLKVTTEGMYQGRRVWHNVTFLPPDSAGAGFSKHWLKVLGEPYSGKVRVNPDNWTGKFVEATIDIDTYQGNSGEEKKKNILADIRAVEAGGDTISEQKGGGANSADLEEVPF